MTPAQIDFLRDFAIDNLPRAKSDREQTRIGGNFYENLAFTATMVRSKSGTTATEFAAASVLESVCLLQRPLSAEQRADTLHNLTDAANQLCLHTGKTIAWLGEVAPPEPEPQPAIHQPLPPIAGRRLSTAEAAQALGFEEQTLRQWASNETGPISSTLVGRRRKWSGDEILEVLKGRAAPKNPRSPPKA